MTDWDPECPICKDNVLSTGKKFHISQACGHKMLVYRKNLY